MEAPRAYQCKQILGLCHDYLVTTPHVVADNTCDDIDELERMSVKYTERLSKIKRRKGREGEDKDD